MVSNDTEFETGTNRRFDVKADITREWFERYAAVLADSAGNVAGTLDCDVRLGPDFDNRTSFRSREAWKNFVLSRWDEVRETRVWQSQGVVRQASCHHRRHHVVLSIQATSRADIDGVVERWSEALSLTPSPINPYRYRRSSLEFQIGDWKPDAFVRGVRAIALLLGSNPDVPEAYAKSFEGDVEKLTSFFDLASFCERVGKKAVLFGEIVVRMEARSVAVGIAVAADHKKLRIRTSLAPEDVDKLISPWPEELGLKQMKVVDTGAAVGGGAVTQQAENPWLKYGVPVAVAFVTAVSVTGAVGLKKAIWPDYKVVVTSPTVSNGMSKWTGNAVSIEWYLQPDQASFRGLKKDVAATVRLYPSSGVQPSTPSKPPLAVSLMPGTYVVSIDAPDATPAQFQLVVEKP